MSQVLDHGLFRVAAGDGFPGEASLLILNSWSTVTMVPRLPGAVSKITSPALSESPPIERQAIRLPGSSARISESHSTVLVTGTHDPVRSRGPDANHSLNRFLPLRSGLDIVPHRI